MSLSRNISKRIDPEFYLEKEKCEHSSCPHCGGREYRIHKTYNRKIKDYKRAEYSVKYCECHACDENFIFSPPIIWQGSNYSSVMIISVLLDDETNLSEMSLSYGVNRHTIAKWRRIYSQEKEALELFYRETKCSNCNELLKKLINEDEHRDFLNRHPDMKLPYL